MINKLNDYQKELIATGLVGRLEEAKNPIAKIKLVIELINALVEHKPLEEEIE